MMRADQDSPEQTLLMAVRWRARAAGDPSAPQEPAPGVLLRDGRQLVEHGRGRVHALGPEHRLTCLPTAARPAHVRRHS